MRRSYVQVEVNCRHTPSQGTAQTAISLSDLRHAVKINGFMLLATLFLAGCATPFRVPLDVARIKLERADSPVVIVEKMWLERKNGPLTVRGYVLKRLSVGDTAQTHLDVTLYDASGKVLRTSQEPFTSRQIVRRHPRPAYASYRVVLDPLPAGVARIEVWADETSHHDPAERAGRCVYPQKDKKHEGLPVPAVYKLRNLASLNPIHL